MELCRGPVGAEVIGSGFQWMIPFWRACAGSEVHKPLYGYSPP